MNWRPDVGTEVVTQVLDIVPSSGFITLLFAMIFKFLPGAKIAWYDGLDERSPWQCFFTAEKFGLGHYLGKKGHPLYGTTGRSQ
jgi:membrane protein